jgi:tellurite resistance protein TerC
MIIRWLKELNEKIQQNSGLRHVRRVVVTVIGGTVLLIGIAMIILPGPAFVVIPAALAILGLEFEWARRWLLKAKEMLQKTKDRATRGGSKRS